MRVLPFWAALLIAVPTLAQTGAPPASPPLLRTTMGIVETGDGDDGRVWFDLVRIDQRFAFDPRKAASFDQVMKALVDSQSTGKSVSVHFFVDGATFDVGSAKPTYIVHDITYGGQTFQLEAQIPPADANAVPLDRDVAAAALAKGIALVGDPDTAPAREALSAAIGSAAIEPALKALALKTRSELAANDALQNRPAGDDRDRLFVLALQDAQSWTSAAPDDAVAPLSVAWALYHLGAYDDAAAVLRAALVKRPQENFRAEIELARIYRTRGQYDLALAELDKLAKSGDGTGMAYHYHRGWTLRLAGRYDEAIAEFTAGLKEQPDYPGAFSGRACAYARTGRLKEAIADWREVLKSAALWGIDTPLSQGTKHDRDRNVEIGKLLDAAYARNPAEKTDAACTGFWDWGEELRARSALLPAAAAAPVPAAH